LVGWRQHRYVECARLNLHVLRLLLGWRWLGRRDFAAGYDQVALHYDDAWLVHLTPVTDRVLAQIPSAPPGLILDLGCGTGYATHALLQREPNRQVLAVDISSGMLARARQRLDTVQVRFAEADMLEFLRSQPTGSAALIVSAWAMGYSDSRAVIREAGRVLAVGGVLAFVVNCADTLRPVYLAFRKCMARFPKYLRRLALPRFPRDWQCLDESLRKTGLAVLWHEDGNHLIRPAREGGGPVLPWLLKTGALAVTDACPYDCWHCSLKERRGGHLRTDQWCDAISALHRLGVSIVGFTGGEPLAREDLADLVGAASRGGAATIVFTSGALMNASRARELRDAGLWALCVSLDHPDPAQHDTLRGSPGAFVRAIEAVRLSRRHGFYTMLSSVATRPFVETRRFEGVLEIARREEVHEYRIVEPMPCGRLGEPDQATLLEPAHVAELRRFHVDTNRTGRLPKVCAFNQVESPEVFGCGAGTQHLFIDAAGEVCPCDFTPLSFGNVTQEPLPDLWLRMNQAMGNNPRTHCFIQKHHAVVRRFSAQGFPLARESSERGCGRSPGRTRRQRLRDRRAATAWGFPGADRSPWLAGDPRVRPLQRRVPRRLLASLALDVAQTVPPRSQYDLGPRACGVCLRLCPQRLLPRSAT